jgi:hypothetical protein
MRKKKSNTKLAVFKISILFILFSINLSCEKDKIGTDYIYYSSFEKETDLTGWVGSYQLQNNAPPGGRLQSMYISGGCVVPHVSFELGPFPEDLNLSVECWGKNLDLGGNVTLTTEDYNSFVYLSIEDESWKHYTTDSVLFCPAGKKLQVELSSGGFVPSSMLIDRIKIVEK